ncbi:MAG: magnesium transporter CorA family protein [Candidatus ainarchaeum sp.]|nr:magnesium transporter CorA family protein [Candidatus ainarchaeum sp.]MDD3085909.1 magnesium transporter CorA family protein [Candidatus ainarchaeum sp.]MDD4468183.1 magnesium transporter CorA family protein [Candidatus ainarchaeum sp.]
MINYYKSTDSLPKLKEVDKITKNTWINLVSPTVEEINFLVDKLDLDKQLIEEMLDYESVPHVEKELREGYISFILRSPVVLEEKGVVTIPLGVVFLTKLKIILTVSKHELFALTKLSTRPPKGFTTKNRVVFFRYLTRKVLNSYMIELNKIEHEINDAEESINNALENKEIAILLAKQNTLVYFKTSIVGNRSVLSRIFSGKIIPLNDDEKDLLDDAIVDIDEAQQLISIYSEIISHTMSAYSSIVSNNLNFVMKVLAIITFTISVPTMIFSFYGMNVHLPFQENPEVIFYLILLTFGLIGVTLFIFKKKKWL